MGDSEHPLRDGLSPTVEPVPVSPVPASIPDAGKCFAQAWWDWINFKADWEHGFNALLSGEDDYDDFGTDDYDMSIEIYGATNNLRLNEAQQRYLFDAGFNKIYVNHKDGWETHYSGREGIPARGWRRRYVSDPGAKTTRVLAGPEDNGYYEISFRPKGWTSPMIEQGFRTGYYRIVPDPLDAKAIEAGTVETGRLDAQHESAGRKALPDD